MNLEHSDVINTLTKHFEEERRLQNELDKMLSTELMLKKSKSELLLQKWHEDVYIPLITKINKEINTYAKHIHDFRRTHHSKYLKHTNKKGGHVFLDIYEKSEYDPIMTMKNKADHIKVVTNWKNDPLLLQILSSIEDNSFLKSYDTGKICNKHVNFPFPPLPLLPLSRSGISCKSWLDMELQDIQSAVRKKSQIKKDKKHCSEATTMYCKTNLKKFFLTKASGVMDINRKEIGYFSRKSYSSAKKNESSKNSGNGGNNDILDIKNDTLTSKNQTSSKAKALLHADSIEPEYVKKYSVSENNNLKSSAKQAEPCVTTFKDVQIKLAESETMSSLRETDTDRALLQFGKSKYSAASSIENCPMRISDTHFDTIKEQLKIALSKRPSKVDPCDIIKSHLKMLYKKVYSSKTEKEKISKCTNKEQQVESNEAFNLINKNVDESLNSSIFSFKDNVVQATSISTSNEQSCFLEKDFSKMEGLIDPYDSKDEFVLDKDEIIRNVVSKLSAEYNEENAESVIEEIFSNIAITKRSIHDLEPT